MQCFIYLPFQKFKDIFFVENSSSDIRIRFLINIIVSAEDLNEHAPKIMFSFLAADYIWSMFQNKLMGEDF